MNDILVVEDQEFDFRIIKAILEEKHHSLTHATSAERALVEIHRHLPALILMDIEMPGMNGLELCQQLKQDEYSAHVPIIFISSYSDRQHIDDAFAAGGVDYIVKPFNKTEVQQRVSTYLMLIEATHRQQQISTLKDILLMTSGLAHELNTPLGNCLTASGSLEMQSQTLHQALNKKSLTAKALDSGLQKIDHANTLLMRNLLKTSEMVGEFQTMFNDYSTPDGEAVNIHDMALMLFEPFTYQSYPFRLSFDVQGQLHMDHGSNTIQRVLLELMANSCKHAQLEPGDNLEVVLKLEQRGQYAQLIYEDNAAELSAEQAAQILSPFYTTARANGALGLGGTRIAQGITLLLNGSIEVQALRPRGVRFSIQVPLQSQSGSPNRLQAGARY
ncbi:two component response regulator [Pseudoalteromonas sp. SW0106-04]|uniref:hybrid sensor histidine kinase/response regulator n=1 Tax=Pseudoalteromonas sp. SW0106-04 TaxID=1702169 RepID=UPI0006B40438|nr:hybrid sensor histidine kinase/response regulator [Pseudoalteromonas sp. SW0106-04]GAP76924.1 two component response regulator [Pseudoalteromonas sp. SW0106-04]